MEKLVRRAAEVMLVVDEIEKGKRMDKIRYCPKCENQLICNDPYRLIYDCPVCENILFESETDTFKGQTKGTDARQTQTPPL